MGWAFSRKPDTRPRVHPHPIPMILRPVPPSFSLSPFGPKLPQRSPSLGLQTLMASANGKKEIPQEGTDNVGESFPAPLHGPGCPTYSGGDTISHNPSTGLSLKNLSLEERTPSTPELTKISPGAAGSQPSSAPAETGAEEGRYSKSKWRRMKSKKRSEPAPQPPSATAAKASGTGGDEARPRAPKVKRQGTDPSEGPSQRPTAKRPNLGQSRTEFSRSSAREQNELAVTVHREDGVKLDDAAATLIKDKMADLIEAAAYGGVSGRCLSFATSGLVSEGFFLVTPMTVEARDWILGCDFGTYNDVPIRCTILSRCRVAIWIPTSRKMPEDPLRLIKCQNDYRTELKISEWTLLHREMQPLGMRLVLGVPQDVISDEPGYVWLNFQATQVQARLLKQKTQSLPKSPTHTDKATQTDAAQTESTGPRSSCRDEELSARSLEPDQRDIGEASNTQHKSTREPRPVPSTTTIGESTRTRTKAARRTDHSESESD